VDGHVNVPNVASSIDRASVVRRPAIDVARVLALVLVVLAVRYLGTTEVTPFIYFQF